MAGSIISEEKRCFICGSYQWIEIHHVFGGANRKLSEKYGLKVPLCHYCHNEPPNGVHFNKKNMRKLQAYAQAKAMWHFRWSIDDFRAIFGRNYL